MTRHSSEPEQGDESIPRAPGGEPLTRGRAMTYREARSWMQRSNALLGRWRGSTIEWVPDHERATFVAWVRQAEGKDCDPSGDVALYRLKDRRPVVVTD
jgi:threonine synthase